MINSRKLISLIIVVTILFTIAVGTEFSAMAQICDDYEYVVLEDGTAEISKYKGNDPDITIPKELDGYIVTSIGDEAFRNNLSIRRLTIQNNIDRVGKKAFCGAYNLLYLNLPEKDIDYGTEAFASCKSLKSLVIPEGVTRISYMMFYRCENLSEVSLPGTLKEIESRAFEQCYLLKNIGFGEGLEKIGYNAFSRCSSLSVINLPSSLTVIESAVFNECICLDNVTIPNGVTTIESKLFKDCTNLKTVNIPETVTNIKSSAFENCVKIKNIELPEGLKTIEYSVFKNCSSLQDLVIPENVNKIYAYAFENCISLVNITIPRKVLAIDKNTFAACDNLQSITIMGEFCRIIDTAIPTDVIIICSKISEAAGYAEANGYKVVYFEEAEDYKFSIINETVKIEKYNGDREDLIVLSELANYPVTIIGSGAFKDNLNLQSIILPNGLKSIENSAFSGCSSLAAVQVPSGVTLIGDDVFASCQSMNELFYPENADIGNASVSENTTKVSYSLNDRNEIVITDIILGSGKSSVIIPDVIADKRVFEVAENVDKSVVSKEGHIHNYYNCECLICSDIRHSGIEHQEYVEPNCISSGNIEYYFCWTCRNYFNDENYENVISYDTIELKPTGHKFSNYIYNNDATYDADGTETAVCDECGFENVRVKPGTKLEKPVVTGPSIEKPSDTQAPSEKPSEKPSDTQAPSEKPSEKPSDTQTPSEKPSEKPSDTQTPSEKPSEQPSDAPNPTEKPDESQKPSNDNSNKENPTDISNDSTITDKPTDKNEPSTTATTVPQNSLRNQEENTTVPASSYNIPTSNDYNSSYSPTPDNNNFASDSDIPTGIYNDSDFSDRQSQNYQENSAVNENDIVITIHVTEKSLILIIVLVVVIFVGVIAIIMVYKKKNDY